MGTTSPARDVTSRPGRLTAAFVHNVAGPGVSSDGRGAHGPLLVVRARSVGDVRNTWTERLSANGRSVKLSLGIYPVITLANARDTYRDRGPRGGRERALTLPDEFETVVALHAANRSGGGRSEHQ